MRSLRGRRGDRSGTTRSLAAPQSLPRGLRRHPQLLGDRLDRRPLRRVLVPMLPHQPHRPLTQLGRVPRGFRHGSILSNSGASRKAGAVQSAVEGLCNVIAGKSGDNLRSAIAAIESRGGLGWHPDFRQAIEKLYGYTNSADGIRHALLAEPNLDYDDAKFMLVMCSSFINYMIAKAAKAWISGPGA